jgi:hypothetical protein
MTYSGHYIQQLLRSLRAYVRRIRVAREPDSTYAAPPPGVPIPIAAPARLDSYRSELRGP